MSKIFIKIFAAVSLAAALILSGIYFFGIRCTYEFSNIVETAYGNDGTIFCVDYDDGRYELYHLTDRGEYISSMKVAETDYENYYAVNDIAVFENAVYCLTYKNSTGDSLSGYWSILRCDIENQSAEEVFIFDSGVDMDHNIFKMTDGKVYYSMFSEDGTAIDVVSEDINQDEEYTVEDTYCSQYIYTSEKYLLENNYISVDYDGSIYITSPDSDEKIYPISDEEKSGTVLCNTDSSGSFVFYDYKAERFMCYNPHDGSLSEIFKGFDSVLEKTGLKTENLKHIQYSEEGFISAVDNDGKYALLICDGSYAEIFQSIYKENNNIISGILTIISALAIVLVLWIFIYFAYLFINRYMPVSVRMTIVFLILFAVTMPIAAVQSARQFEKSVHENNITEIENVMYSRLEFLGYESVNEKDYKSLLNRDWGKFAYYYGECSEPESEEYMSALLRVCFETNYEFHPEIIENSQNREIDLMAKFFAVYFDEGDGKLLLCADSRLVSSPVEYIYNDKVSEAYYSVMETSQPAFVEEFLGMYNQMYSCYLVPVKNESGKTVGIYELNWGFEEIRQKTNEFVFDFVMYCTAVIFVVSVIIVAVTIMFISPLKEMNKKAIMLAEGHTGVKTSVRGNNDISSLCMDFNYYSESIHKNISEFKALSQAYKYYMPESILEIFDKSNISDINSGDKRTVNAYIVFMKLSVNELPFSSRRLENSLNEIFESIAPVIEGYGGTILQYSHDVIPIIYTEKNDSAVRCAISVSQIVNSTFSKYSASVCSVISFETLSFEAIGNEDNMRIELKSENLAFISELAEMSGRLNIGILVTDRVSEKSENFFSVFSTRYTGIRNDSNGNAVKIYDVFDGDVLYSKNMKRLTKEDFESAVELYTIGRCDMARNTFTNILKSYTDDKISVYYISECSKGENKT